MKYNFHFLIIILSIPLFCNAIKRKRPEDMQSDIVTKFTFAQDECDVKFLTNSHIIINSDSEYRIVDLTTREITKTIAHPPSGYWIEVHPHKKNFITHDNNNIKLYDKNNLELV